MKFDKNLVSMGCTEDPFPPGTHMCLIYSHEEERRSVIGKFLENGIIGNEKVVYFADIMKPEEVRDWLLEMDIELPRDDRFSVHVAENIYCPGGEFIPEQMINTVREICVQAKKAGFSNVRGSGETSWVLKGIPGSDRFMEYESLLNELFLTYPATAICQYDANKFSGATILDVLKTHPRVIVHGQIVQNPYYLKPQDFLKDYKPGFEKTN